MNLVIIPYHHKIEPFIKVINKIEDCSIISVVASPAVLESLKGDSYFEENAIHITKGVNNISSEYDGIVLFSEFIDDYTMEQYELLKKENLKIYEVNNINETTLEESEFHSIPTIGISRVNNSIPTLLTIVKLKELFAQQNLRATIITNSQISELCGFYSLPSHNKVATVTEAVKLIRHHIRDICELEKADVLLVEIPGTIDEVDNLIYQKALNIDYNIVCVNAFKYDKKQWQLFKDECRDRFCGHIDAFVMSEYACNYMGEENSEISLEETTIQGFLCEEMYSGFDVKAIFEDILQKLQKILVIA